jgi:hypothetical protein
LYNLYIKENFRGYGFGNQLMDYTKNIIIDNGYNVSQIELPLSKVQRFIKHDYPKYLGDGKFEYKGKTITYKQSNPGTSTYEAYDSNDKLIRTFTSPNKDFESFMGFLKQTGKTQYTDNSPYNIINTLQEIRVTGGRPVVYKPIPENELYKVKNFPAVDTSRSILSNPYIVEILDKVVRDVYDGSLEEFLNINDDPESEAEEIASGMSAIRPFQTVYIHPSGDGTIYFVNSLEEFSGKYKTEEGWGITGWEQI